MWRGCEWRHARRRWAKGFGWFLKKKQWVEIRSRAKRFDFWASVRPGGWGLRDSPRIVGSDWTVSIVEIESLSSCWKPKSQGGNKSFVPEQRKSSVFRVFRDFYVCERFTDPYILRICIFEHFTYPYISHIVLWLRYNVNVLFLCFLVSVSFEEFLLCEVDFSFFFFCFKVNLFF